MLNVGRRRIQALLRLGALFVVLQSLLLGIEVGVQGLVLGREVGV
jgi:hypothetical protein